MWRDALGRGMLGGGMLRGGMLRGGMLRGGMLRGGMQARGMAGCEADPFCLIAMATAGGSGQLRGLRGAGDPTRPMSRSAAGGAAGLS